MKRRNKITFIVIGAFGTFGQVSTKRAKMETLALYGSQIGKRKMAQAIQNFQTIFNRIDWRITRWMARYSLDILRFGLGVIFVWFGALKFFPGLSPAEELVRNTIYFFDPDFFLPILALWEVLIGLGFLSGFFTNKLQRLTILLLFLQLPGTALPLVLLPEVCWSNFPYVLTLEGQYIIKNLAIIGSALVLGATVRGGRLVPEPINSQHEKE